MATSGIFAKIELKEAARVGRLCGISSPSKHDGRGVAHSARRLQRVDSLYVDGVRQPDGFYGGSGSSAQHKPAWIEGDGSGVLRVGKFGSILLVY